MFELTEALTTKDFAEWEPRVREMERRTGDWIDFRVPEKELGRVRVLERGVAMDLAAAIEEMKEVEVAEQAIFFSGVEGAEQSRELLLL